MKVLIIESNEAKIDRNYKSTSIVHVRNSCIIADFLDADLISIETEIPRTMEKTYDAIICMYASGYMMYKKYLKILTKNKNARIFWCVNEYALPDNILLRNFVKEHQIGYGMIANLERESYKQSLLNLVIAEHKLNTWIEDWHMLNLNALIFDVTYIRSVEPTLFGEGKEDCLYYSTYRPDRLNDLLDYNSGDYAISTSKKNRIKFEEANIKARFTDKLDWTKGYETLFQFKYSIYLEDTHTHTHFNHMANRFYECLMLDVLLFFDYRCDLVISRSGYNVDEFMIVKNGDDLNEKMKIIDEDQSLYDRLLEVQRSNYSIILQEKQDVLHQIKAILESPKPVVERLDEDKVQKKNKTRVKEIDPQIELF